MQKGVGSDGDERTVQWRRVTLGEVVELKRGYDLPRRERVSGSIPLVSSSGITDYHEEAKVKGPGVVTGRYGTLGKVYYVPEDFWPLNTTLYVRDFKGNDPRFIAYFLGNLDFSVYSDKAAVPGLNRNHLHQALVHVPLLPEQRAIAHILGTLDDKIELNRRMNETLEEMARALFKSWFVDFEPVRAKMEGRWRRGESLLGMPAELYDLFPDGMVDSELGEIPGGWEVKRMGDIIEIHDSVRVPLNSRQRAQRQGPYPYYGAAGIMDYVDDFLFEGIFVLTGEDGSVVDSEGYPVVQYVWGRFWVNNHAHVLKGKNGVSQEHLYLLLQLENIAPFVTGAVQPKLSQKNLKAIPVVLPTQATCQAFFDLIQPMFAALRNNTGESNSLAVSRDALLSKLMSGEVRLKQSEPLLVGVK